MLGSEAVKGCLKLSVHSRSILFCRWETMAKITVFSHKRARSEDGQGCPGPSRWAVDGTRGPQGK